MPWLVVVVVVVVIVPVVVVVIVVIVYGYVLTRKSPGNEETIFTASGRWRCN